MNARSKWHMELQDVIELAESLKGAHLLRLGQSEIEARVQRLVRGCRTVFGTGYDWHYMWHRGRVCDNADGWDDMRECIYHKDPKELRGFGRTNYPGEAVFYTSWNHYVLLTELQPNPGAFVQVVATRVRPGKLLHCFVVGEMNHVFQSGQSQLSAAGASLAQEIGTVLAPPISDETMIQLYVDAFMAEQYSRRVVHLSEYHVTAAFARFLFNTGAALIYPSVEIRAGMNIAVPAPLFYEMFEVLYTTVYEVVEAYGYGLWKVVPRKGTFEFQDGKAIWNSARRNDLPKDALGRFQVPETATGWRVKP